MLSYLGQQPLTLNASGKEPVLSTADTRRKTKSLNQCTSMITHQMPQKFNLRQHYDCKGLEPPVQNAFYCNLSIFTDKNGKIVRLSAKNTNVKIKNKSKEQNKTNFDGHVLLTGLLNKYLVTEGRPQGEHSNLRHREEPMASTLMRKLMLTYQVSV